MSHEEWNRKHWKPLAPMTTPPGENDLDPPAPEASAEASAEASEASEKALKTILLCRFPSRPINHRRP